MHIKHTGIAKAAGTNHSWCEKCGMRTIGGRYLTAAATTVQVKCFSNCGHRTEPLYVETKGIQ